MYKLVEKLSKGVLSKSEIISVNKIIYDIEEGSKREALQILANVLGQKPKRPLYYIYDYIFELPERHSRDIIRYLGDYIGKLVNCFLSDKGFISKLSLGPRVKKMKKYVDEDFYNVLELFNEVYVDAKHEFDYEKDRSIFNYIDTVYMVYIAKNIADKIIPLSKPAQDYINGIDKKW